MYPLHSRLILMHVAIRVQLHSRLLEGALHLISGDDTLCNACQ